MKEGETIAEKRVTRHNGRSGKNGVYNPKHNDRSFNLSNAEHIDSRNANYNILWDCYHGFTNLEMRNNVELAVHFEEVERLFYLQHYSDYCACNKEEADTPDTVTGKIAKEDANALIVKQFEGSLLQGGKPQEQQAETHQELSQVGVLLDIHQQEGKEHQRNGYGAHAETTGAETKGKNPRSDRSTDVCTHDYGNCAAQGQQTGIYKTHDEQGSGG